MTDTIPQEPIRRIPVLLTVNILSKSIIYSVLSANLTLFSGVGWELEKHSSRTLYIND